MTIRKGKTIIAGNIPAGYEIGDIGLSAIGIDESLNYRRYLNGQEILQAQFPEFTKKIKRRVELYPSLACSDYQYETYLLTSAHGQCGKFVIDDERGVIRLPKVVNVMGLSDMAEAGVTVDAGLPNITGGFALGGLTGITPDAKVEGAFYMGDTLSKVVLPSTDTRGRVVNIDASLSNPIYGNSDTVQQEAIKYPYFIQVASSSETTINLTRDIELNNPFSLFEYKFSEYAIDNISWLESKGQWNSNRVYVSAYEELLAIYNGKVREGVSVKKTTETYTDYDFVIDEAGSAFRLPLKVLGASSKAVVGNGMTLGLTEGSSTFSVANVIGSGFVASTNYGSQVGSPYSDITTSNTGIGVTTDPNYSGIETSTEGMKLYFYVGETVQDSNLINAGAVLEDVNTLKNTALTNNQITNCITEIPQRIKLELNDGALTLKAGSVVIVPNGFEEDGVTPKFDYVTVESDLSLNYASGNSHQFVVFYGRGSDNNAQGIWYRLDQECFSGTTAPTTTMQYMAWYDTNTNLLKFTENTGQNWYSSEDSFPICTITASQKVDSIDQTFNGMGYIGSTVWVDKGVKGLMPNGRNADGSLKNIEWQSSQLKTFNAWVNDTTPRMLVFKYDGQNLDYTTNFSADYCTNPVLRCYFEQPNYPVFNVSEHIMWFNTEENRIYTKTANVSELTDEDDIVILGYETSDGTGITSMNTKYPFRAVDYSDSSTVSGWAMPSNKYIELTLGASGTTYTAPANGWFMLATAYNGTHYITLDNQTSIVGFVTQQSAGTIKHSIPAKKGDIIYVEYNALTSFLFRFIYAEGEV